MPLYSQGENYEEGQSAPKPRARSRKPPEPEVDEDSVVDEEVEESPKKKKKKQPVDTGGGGSMSPKLIACIVGLVVLLILAVGLFLFVSGNKKEQESIKESKALEEYMEYVDPIGVNDEAPVGVNDGAPVGVDGSEQPVGIAGLDSGAEQPVGIAGMDSGSQTVTENTQSTSGGVGEFNAKTADTLRKWGFTNSQMEIAQRDGISAEDMVAQAKQERKEAQYEAMMEAADATSEAYQKLLQQTWLGQPPMDISGFNDINTMYQTETKTENVDYDKIEAHGRQLWIKCYLEDGTTAFMQCTPARYNSLPDSGNIVIQYTMLVAGDSRVITAINEYKVN